MPVKGELLKLLKRDVAQGAVGPDGQVPGLLDNRIGDALRPPPPPIIPPWAEIFPLIVPDLPAFQRYLDSLTGTERGGAIQTAHKQMDTASERSVHGRPRAGRARSIRWTGSHSVRDTALFKRSPATVTRTS